MAAVMSVTEADTMPGYPWFQEREQAKNTQAKIIEMNHLADRNEASRQEISYGNQVRTEKVGFGIRDAVERNGLAGVTAVEKVNGENRITTLTTKLSEARQQADDFTKIFLATKENRIAEAKAVSNQKITGIQTALEFELDVLDGEASKGRAAIRDVMLQDAQQTGSLKNQESWKYGMLAETKEVGFRRVELEQLFSRFGSVKDEAFASIQAVANQADDNRRMALYRAETESRVDAVTAAALLQAAENRTKEILYQMGTEAECCCETKLLVSEQNGATDSLITATGTGATRDSLAAAQQEALVLRLKHC